MKQLYINQYEKVASNDINDLQMAAAQSMQDDCLYRFFGQPAAAVFGSDLTVSFVGALACSIAPGTGFFFDNTQTGYVPKFRMIKLATAVATVHAAADPTNPRIDRICLAPNLATTSSASRFVKTGGTGPVALQTVAKTKEMTYTLQVVTGTPGGSPSAPATPAGYISLATVLVAASTGIAGAGSITDTRVILGLTVSNTGHLFLTSGTIQTQLDDADAALSKFFYVSVTGNITLSRTTHGGRMLQMDSSGGAFSITLPAASANAGLKCRLSDIKGQLGTNLVTLIPNGTDKIRGLNANYTLESSWGDWELYCDATVGWNLK